MRVLLTAILAGLTAATCHAATALTIAQRPAAVVDGSRVALADVAAISGGTPAATERLGSIDLGPAPGAGSEREFSRDFLVRRTRQEGVDAGSVSWAGAQDTRVARRTTRLVGAVIAQAAASHVRKTLPWPDEDLVVEVAQAPRDVLVPGAASDLVLRAGLPPRTQVLGQVPCSVTIARGGRVVARSSVLLRVRVFQNLLVARRRIRRGQVLTKEHVRLQRTELTHVTTDALTSLADALGTEARHEIRPLTVLTPTMVRARRVVRRGAVVTLVAETPLLRISARGIAQQDGAVGECIAAQNIDSRKVVYGRVRDADTLEVSF